MTHIDNKILIPLIKKSKSKNKKIRNEAFDNLYHILKIYIDGLAYKYCMNLEVEECQLLCLEALWKATIKYDPNKGTFLTYYYRFARSAMQGEYRKLLYKKNINTSSLENIKDENGELNIIVKNSPLENCINKENEQTIESELEDILSKRQKSCFWEHVVEGASNKYIAKEKKMKNRSVNNAITEAKYKIKSHFLDAANAGIDFITSSAS